MFAQTDQVSFECRWVHAKVAQSRHTLDELMSDKDRGSVVKYVHVGTRVPSICTDPTKPVLRVAFDETNKIYKVINLSFCIYLTYK